LNTKFAAPGLGAPFAFAARMLRSYCRAPTGLAASLISAVASFALTACGGGGGAPAAPTTYSLNAEVSGLSGSGLILELANGTKINVSGNGIVTLANELSTGASYDVTVSATPVNPSEACTVLDGSGTISSKSVNIAVSCTTSGVAPTSSSVSLDSSVASATGIRISQIVSPSGSTTPGGWLPISTATPSGESIALALDSSGAIRLAAVVISDQTVLSATSTAIALAHLAMADIPTSQTGAAIDAAIQADPAFQGLVNAVQAAVNAGHSPASDQVTLQDIAAVLGRIGPQIQSASAATRGPSQLKWSPTTPPLNLTNGLPATVVQDPLGVFPVQVTGSGNSLLILNSMPIPWVATTTSVTGTQLDQEPVTESSLFKAATNNYVLSSTAGVTLTVGQTLSTEQNIIIDLMKGITKSLLSFTPAATSCSSALINTGISLYVDQAASDEEGWNAAVEALQDAWNSPDMDEVLSKCISSSAAAKALAQASAEFFTAIYKVPTAATAVVTVLSTAVEGYYAYRFWGQTVGPIAICENTSGGIVNCASSYTFSPTSVVLAPGATYLPNITAVSNAGPPTGIPSGLIWTTSNPIAVSVTAANDTSGVAQNTLVANTDQSSVGGPYTITVMDQDYGATGSYQATVVNPIISPVTSTVYIGASGSSGQVTLTLTGANNRPIVLPNGVHWTCTNSGGSPCGTVGSSLVALTGLDNTTLCTSSSACIAASTWSAPAGTTPNTVTITASGPNGLTWPTASATITVSDVILSISPTEPTVAIGSTVALSVSATDSSGDPIATPPNLQWSSSNGTLATVSNAIVTGVAIPASGVSQPTITVVDPASGATASVIVTVTSSVNAWLGNWTGTTYIELNCQPPAGANATTLNITAVSGNPNEINLIGYFGGTAGFGGIQTVSGNTATSTSPGNGTATYNLSGSGNSATIQFTWPTGCYTGTYTYSGP
jgi:hypothetical protein